MTHKKNVRKPPRKNGAATPIKKVNQSRTASGRVPQGRTLTTRDKYLNKKAKQPEKERPVVVIETNARNDLAVVQLSSRAGKDRTRLKNYQQGQSRFKHYVEIMDDEGNPIRVNQKFKENHPNMDVSRQDVDTIVDTVFNHSKPMQKNRKRINKFRGKKG
ncbi:MAG: hypothetical protein HFK05_03560 [Clostridia bacterium]|nr:hypothetical protein [Clostridia bacterium]